MNNTFLSLTMIVLAVLIGYSVGKNVTAEVHWKWATGGYDTIRLQPGQCVELQASGPGKDGYGYSTQPCQEQERKP